jgi:hypothetical protein
MTHLEQHGILKTILAQRRRDAGMRRRGDSGDAEITNGREKRCWSFNQRAVFLLAAVGFLVASWIRAGL